MLNKEEKEAMIYFYNLRSSIDESYMLFDEELNVKCGKNMIKQISIIINLINRLIKNKERIENMKVLEFIEKKELINKFAKEMARLQKKADRYFYVENNKEMSDYMLIYASELRDFASKLGIKQEMYQEAYKIYNFKNSGKTGYKPTMEELEELKNWYDIPTENF